MLRGLRRRTRHAAEGNADELLEAAVDPRPDPHQRLTSLESRRLVAETIERLPVDAREVVTLYYREGRSVAQVANLLGLSDAAVRQRLSRARACLRADLLERAGHELAASAPGAAFVAGVTTALTLGAPAMSAATTVGMTSFKTGGALAKIAAAIGGAGIGAVGGVAGIVLRVRQARRQARDEQERTGLRRLQVVGIAVVLAFVIAVSVSAGMLAQGRMLAHGRWVAVGLAVAYYLSLFAIFELWLPRIQRRRFEAEVREDPVGARQRRKRERTGRVVGWTMGLVLGATGLVVALLRWSR
jgi:hypothetical protein